MIMHHAGTRDNSAPGNKNKQWFLAVDFDLGVEVLEDDLNFQLLAGAEMDALA